MHPFPPYKTAATGADRSKLPETSTPPELRLPKLERVTLSNGLKVILAERHEIPVVELLASDRRRLCCRSVRRARNGQHDHGIAGRGYAKRTALQISEEEALLGAEVHASSNLDTSTVFISALKSNLDRSLELYADLILHPSFPETDFLRLQKQRIAGIQREKVTPVPMALRVFPGLLYGDGHAYGNPLTGSGTEASVAKLTREDLVKFHDTWFKPNHSTLIVVGDLTLE